MPSVPKDTSDLFDHLIPEALTKSPDRARALDTIFCFKILGEGDWIIDCSRDAEPPMCGRGDVTASNREPHCTIEIGSVDFASMLSDPNVGMQLYFQKRLRISGDSSHATKIASVFELVQAL